MTNTIKKSEKEKKSKIKKKKPMSELKLLDYTMKHSH